MSSLFAPDICYIVSMSKQFVIILHNLRSTHNVGSLIRTSEGFGLDKIYFTGYTPYPLMPKNDPRLPFISDKLTRQIHKTALGAENMIAWAHHDSLLEQINILRDQGYQIVALEQHPTSHKLPNYNPPGAVALIVGNEVEGLPTDILNKCDEIIEIPMYGKKESYNVVQAAAIALYHIKILAN